MSKRIFTQPCIWATCLVMLFVTSNAMAGADWQERQKKMFSQLSVKPGDFIDKSNWEKAKGLVPESIVNWVRKGEWILKIGEFKYDFDYTPEWYEVSQKNAGKYGLGQRQEVIELKTGKFPMFLRGEPFPDVDVKNDPDGATKFMQNFQAIYQLNSSFWCSTAEVQWIGATGYERGFSAGTDRFCFWERPRGEIPNPNEYLFMSLSHINSPYDVRGMVNMFLRYLDGRDDNVYAYIPSIRRVKRLSGANRSDPFMGGDATHDDQNGFEGQVESMKWTYLDDKVMLVPRWEGDLQRPRIYKRNQQGALEVSLTEGIRYGWQVEGWTGAPWAMVNEAWVPREVWILKAEPIDPYYQYGHMDFYMDKLSKTVVYNIKYSRAGEYWKTNLQGAGMNVIHDEPLFAFSAHAFNIYGPQAIVDDKIRHATNTPVDMCVLEIDSPKAQPRNFTPAAIRTMSK